MFPEVASRPVIFQEQQIIEAVGYALSGGQALHLFCWSGRLRNAAHLFDQDRRRLIELACEVGADVYIHREGERFQHILLRGLPLARALAVAAGFSAGGSVAEEDERQDRAAL